MRAIRMTNTNGKENTLKGTEGVKKIKRKIGRKRGNIYRKGTEREKIKRKKEKKEKTVVVGEILLS